MSVKVSAGEFRDMFDLMRKVEVEDPMGGKALRLETVRSNVRGKITPVSSRELLFAQQRVGNTSHIVRMRWHPEGLDKSWVIQWGTRVLAILGCRNVEERNRLWELDCEERAPEGANL